MKRPALIFLAAIFGPSLVLGWLALRTAGEQRILIERQATDLRQAETDAFATQVSAFMAEKQRVFAEAIRGLTKQELTTLAKDYGPLLAQVWPDGGTAFAIAPGGKVAYPTPQLAERNRRDEEFLQNNAAFLSNRTEAEIYQPQQLATSKTQAVAPPQDIPDASIFSTRIVQKRSISPQNSFTAPSKVAPAFSNFDAAVRENAQGFLARFVQDELQVLFWTRPDANSEWLFGVMLGSKELGKMMKEYASSIAPDPDFKIAILDEKVRPVAEIPANFQADWKRPFVATEIGEVLPHWEVALYLNNPGKLADSARLVNVTVILLIMLALGVILAGGYFVAMDTRRQLALAQKKTDFVSNVSHELKTPLTSIRMFAELLAEDRVKEPEKRTRYLRIISTESERLARLVNNVLDFARLEKKQSNYTKQERDLYPIIAHIWETESMRLREAGFTVHWEAGPGPYPVVCDNDAISQVLVNLISNAEKYHGPQKEITLETVIRKGFLHVSVLDRGAGVPRELSEKIFEAFYRADDSLSSGIQGSGLGLTLARSIAREHDGDLVYTPRLGGGSIFTLQLPLYPPAS